MTFPFTAMVRRFLKDESGLSAVEYGLLAAGIVIGLYSLIFDIGTTLRSIYTDVGSQMTKV